MFLVGGIEKRVCDGEEKKRALKKDSRREAKREKRKQYLKLWGEE